MFVRYLCLAGAWCAVLVSNTRAADSGAEFTKLFGEWKTTLAQLRELQVQYSTAKDDEKPELRKKYDALIESGSALVDKVTQAAGEAFKAKPNSDGEPAEFLATAAHRAYSREEYETAQQWFRTLFDNGFSKSQLLEPAAAAAFCTNDFDTAGRLFKQATEQKVQLKGEKEKEWAALVPEYKKHWEKEAEIRAAEAKADDLPRVKLQTSAGDIVLELFENEAPNAVANFISLVEKKFYDGTVFHRVLRQFMAQGGDPTGTGGGGPGYRIPCECYQPNHRLHFRGSLSMAHAGRDTGGSQFFLTFVPTDHLNGRHTVFGRVIEGLDVLAKLQRIDPEKPATAKPDKIVSATVVRKRDHEYTPKKVGQ